MGTPMVLIFPARVVMKFFFFPGRHGRCNKGGRVPRGQLPLSVSPCSRYIHSIRLEGVLTLADVFVRSSLPLGVEADPPITESSIWQR